MDTAWVRPEVLRRLREHAGLSIDDAAAQSRKLTRAHFAPLTAGQIRQWEAGHGTPELEHLETLSELYHRPVGHFLLSEIPEDEIGLSFRGLAPGKEDQFDPITRASLRRFVELAAWFATRLEEHAVGWNVRIPESPLRPPAVGKLAQRERKRLGFSKSIRETWRSPHDAFQWWRLQIEAQGVLCFELKLNPKDVRGASLWVGQRYPFILVNRQDAEASTGRLFTLLHEYGHLLLSRQGHGTVCDFRGREKGKGTEPLVNQFAAQVLLPVQELWEHLSQQGQPQPRERWSDATLKQIASQFLVSRDVVAITLEELRLAAPGFYLEKRQDWERSAAKYQPRGRARAQKKWQRKARELGGAGLKVLLRLHTLDALPMLDAAYLLDTKVEKLSQFLAAFRTAVHDE